MNYSETQLWKQFSSVRLALIIITLLAATSIIGTIIPQGEQITFYIERYGSRIAMIFEILALTDMYSSFWFRTLLVLFCLNLVICSYSRIPTVIKLIRKDNLNINNTRFNDSSCLVLSTATPKQQAGEIVKSTLTRKKLKSRTSENGKSTVLFFEKGAWTRLAPYVVHLSILVIFAGAIIGNIFGYKAFVMVPEGKSISVVYSHNENNRAIHLGFEIFCEKFSIEYYKNGTPKEYRSDLSVIENGQEIFKKSITVNDPLSFKGITFYQSSYQPIPDQYSALVSFRPTAGNNNGAATQEKFSAEIRQTTRSKNNAFHFTLLSASKDGHGHGPYTIRFDDATQSSVTFMVNDSAPVTVKRPAGIYTFTLNQQYSTGLQVVKDPGVLLVYIGCSLMLFGLYVSFFMSHKKIWILLRSGKAETELIIRGTTNKHNDRLEKLKNDIALKLQNVDSLAIRRG